MKKKIVVHLGFLISFLLIMPLQADAFPMLECLFLKITVVENGVEHEWEYTSPRKYEYEKGERVIKTDEAKQEMHAIVQTINLSEEAKIEEMVQALKQEKFPKLERLDIRWMTGENKLYTWVWDNE